MYVSQRHLSNNSKPQVILISQEGLQMSRERWTCNRECESYSIELFSKKKLSLFQPSRAKLIVEMNFNNRRYLLASRKEAWPTTHPVHADARSACQACMTRLALPRGAIKSSTNRARFAVQLSLLSLIIASWWAVGSAMSHEVQRVERFPASDEAAESRFRGAPHGDVPPPRIALIVRESTVRVICNSRTRIANLVRYSRRSPPIPFGVLFFPNGLLRRRSRVEDPTDSLHSLSQVLHAPPSVDFRAKL